MSVVKAPPGSPPPGAAALIEQIRTYARASHGDPAVSLEHVVGMLHIAEAVRRELPASFAAANEGARTGRPGAVSYRDLVAGTGVVKGTVQKYVNDGGLALRGEAA